MSSLPHRFSAEDRRHQILEVARGLFARKGYNGTTTREIAQSAGVNEALIFRHFPTKEELYWAVIDSTCRAAEGLAAMERTLAQGGDLVAVFAEIAEAILDRRDKDPTFTRLLLYSALENHELTKRFFSMFAGQYYETLSRFIKDQIDKGTIRELDPLLAARGFLGMVIYHSMVENVFLHARNFSNRKVAETIAQIWVDGVASSKFNENQRGAALPRSSKSKTNRSNLAE
jgi:AcrR family transcriptional regulator